LLAITLESKQYQKAVTRFCVGQPSPFQLAASLRKTGYLSHGTAAYLHGLLKKPPHSIYLNVEQSANPSKEKSLSSERHAISAKRRHSLPMDEDLNLSDRLPQSLWCRHASQSNRFPADLWLRFELHHV